MPKTLRIQTKAQSTEPMSFWRIKPIAKWQNIRTKQLYILVEFQDAVSGKLRKVVVPRADYGNINQLTRILLDAGANLPANSENAKDIVAKSCRALPDRSIIVTDKSGWYLGKHMHPGRSVRIDNKTQIRFGNPTQYTAVSSERIKKGNLEYYLRSMRELTSQSDYLTFSLALAFSGPTLAFSPIPETAFFLLVGVSSSGKTTAERAAEGASASSASGQLRNFDFTPRGLEELVGGQYNDRLITIDELMAFQGGQNRSDLDAIHRIIHKLSGGTGRTISKRAQSADLPTQSWQVMLLSAVEESVRAKLRVGRYRGLQGIDVRLIEIPVPHVDEGGIFNRSEPEHSVRLSEQTDALLNGHYGHLELPFVEYLENDMANAKLLYGFHWNSFLRRFASNLGGAELRIAKKFAHVYASGHLAIKSGAAPFSRFAIRCACKDLMNLSLRSLREDEPSLKRTAIHLLTFVDGGGNDFASVGQRHGQTLLFVDGNSERLSATEKEHLERLSEAAKLAGALIFDKGRNKTKRYLSNGARPNHFAFDLGWLKSLSEGEPPPKR